MTLKYLPSGSDLEENGKDLATVSINRNKKVYGPGHAELQAGEVERRPLKEGSPPFYRGRGEKALDKPPLLCWLP